VKAFVNGSLAAPFVDDELLVVVGFRDAWQGTVLILVSYPSDSDYAKINQKFGAA